MTAISADVVKAILTHWSTKALDQAFRAERADEDASIRVIFDSEAKATTPLPYCIFEQAPGTVDSRMSGKESGQKQRINEAIYQFRVHATGKEEAAELARLIKEAFEDAQLVVPNANHVITQFEADFGVRDDERGQWRWVVRYRTLYDEMVVSA